MHNKERHEIIVSKTCIKEGTLIRLSRSMTFSTHYIFFRDSGITTGVCKQCPKGAGWFVALSTLEASKIKLPFFFSLELSQSLKLLLKIDSQFYFLQIKFCSGYTKFYFLQLNAIFFRSNTLDCN